MSDNELTIVRGSDNSFRDAGLSDPDTKLMKADLAAAIIRILRERALNGARAAALAGVTEADISRIRNADLNRFTIDRLVSILNRLHDPGTGDDLVHAMANPRARNLDFEHSKLRPRVRDVKV